MARGSQPPRPAPRPSKAPSRGAAKGGAARGGAKGTPAKGGAKGGAQGARKPQPAKAQPGKPLPRGVRQPAGRGATAEQLRQQRLMLDQQRRQREARWWVINQNAMKDLHSRQHHAAGGEAIGTILNADRRMRWRTSHAVGAITLLILSFFFASMAVGAQSMGIGVLAFLCLAGCIAFFTVEHSKRRFPQPVPAPPLIGQHRLEDLIVEDDPPRGAPVREPDPSTISALNDMFTPRPEAAPQTDAVPPAKAEAPAKPTEVPAKSSEAPSESDGVPEAVPAPARAVAAEPVPAALPDEPAKAAIEAEPVRDEPAGAAIEAEPASEEPAKAAIDAEPTSDHAAQAADEAEPAPDEPAKTTLAAESPRIIVTEPVHPGPAVEDVEAEPRSAAASESAPPPGGAPPGTAPGVAFSLPSEQVGGDASSAAPAPPPPSGDASPPKGPIAEAVTRLKAPSPPRQRTSTEGRSLAHDLAELLLSEQRLGGTDVTDVAATLVVADLQRSVEFYTDALGLTIADRTDEAAVLDAGFGKILLWERRDAPPGETGVMHLTFEVGDIDSTFAKMNEAGVEFLHLPRTALLGQHYEMRAASFRDPDGHGLAITEHRERE
jgi:catechol 2,3-dioxygenase-like lactoylglutathione lyase family enzyme